MNIYNDETYLKNNPTWHEEDAGFKADKILKILQENSISFNSICEIGCGSGEILVELSAKLPAEIKYYGFDISKDAINIAKQKECTRIKFELQDITQNDHHENYDVILVVDILEHLENYFEFLRGISSKGKYTIFHIPLDLSTWSLFREKMLIESKERVGHIHNFTEGLILKTLTDFGFEIIDKFYTEPLHKPTNIKEKIIHFSRKLLFKINQSFCTKTIGGYSVLVLTKNKISS